MPLHLKVMVDAVLRTYCRRPNPVPHSGLHTHAESSSKAFNAEHNALLLAIAGGANGSFLAARTTQLLVSTCLTKKLEYSLRTGLLYGFRDCSATEETVKGRTYLPWRTGTKKYLHNSWRVSKFQPSVRQKITEVTMQRVLN